MSAPYPTVSFSYDFSKGSVESRRKMAQMLNQEIYNNLIKLFKKKNKCDIDTFERMYNASLPEGKSIEFNRIESKYADEFWGELEGITDENDRLVAFNINIANKDNNIYISSLPTIMHESRHLLDFMLNPKYVKVDEAMTAKNLYDSAIVDFYEDFIYVYEKKNLSKGRKQKILNEVETGLRDVLKNMSFDDQVLCLKFLRQQISTEYYAHIENYRYANMLSHHWKIPKSQLHDEPEGYMFREKLSVVNKVFRELIYNKHLSMVKENQKSLRADS